MRTVDEKRLRIELFTESRKDLFNIAAILARGIEDTFLQDKGNPVTVAVNGSFDAGKSIFPDVARRVLMSSVSHLAFSGDLKGDEFWYGMRKGGVIEVDFLNINRCYYQESQEYLGKRKFGGVTFVHNTAKDEQCKFGIDIWLESELKYETRVKKTVLSGEFEKRSRNKWNRYLAIDVQDERLCASEAFNKAVASIEAGAYRNGGHYGYGLALKWYLREKLMQTKEKLGINARNLKKMGGIVR